jgi:PAS domain S-box-containing protein
MLNTDKPNILIVDDDLNKLRVMEEILADMNLNIMAADSGNEAFRLLMKNDFAVILLDVKMPGIDGFETADLIRKRVRSQATPIIFITSYSPDEINVKKGYSLGTVDYVFAPINPEILRSKVSVFVKLSRLNEEANTGAVQGKNANKAPETSGKQNDLLNGTNIKLDCIFNIMPFVLFTLKPTENFTVTYATKNTLELLGYEAEEFIKNPGLWVECIRGDDMEQVFSGFPKLFEKGTYTCEYRFKRKSGEYIWVQNVLKLIHEDDNDLPVEILGCLVDLSERKLVEEQLLRKTEELERSNAELEHFAYIASHDLQEPLRAISSYLQLIERKSYYETFDEKGKDYFKRVINGAKRMQDMINDLLQYSRVVSNRDKFAPCDCNELIVEVINNLRVLIKETEARIHSGPMPIVNGNQNQLLRVFQNIIGNGLKFRKEDQSPVIEIQAVRENNKWLFSFEDNGIGIKEESKERIFEIFQRLNARDKYPGTGIGLAVCKKAIANHGGEIWVESEVGKGSTFYFSIPDKKENER